VLSIRSKVKEVLRKNAKLVKDRRRYLLVISNVLYAKVKLRSILSEVEKVFPVVVKLVNRWAM
jgi:hypothetical protein